MSATPDETNAPAHSDQSSFLQVAVWYGSQVRQISDDFAIEIIDQETWKPTYGPWEAKHTFDGLRPGEPYELLIHPVDSGGKPISLRFWAPEPRAREQSYPDYLIEITDDQLILLNPGVRSSERRFPREQELTTFHRADEFWQRWGLKIVGAFVICMFAAILILNYFGDDGQAEPGRPAPGSAADEAVNVTLRARLLDGSEEMVVEIANETGGTEQRVMSDIVWESTRVNDVHEFQRIEVQNLSETGGVRCQIFIDGEPWIYAESFGRGVKATCEGYPAEALR